MKKLTTVTLHQSPPTLALSPEAREHLRKVYEPCDLNEALVSVQHDEVIARMQKVLESKLNKQFAKFLFQTAAP